MTQTMTSHLIGQHITGPRQLIELLHSHREDEPKNEYLEIWLNSESQCVTFEAHDASDLVNGNPASEDGVLNQLLVRECDSEQNSLIVIFTVATDVELRDQLPALLLNNAENLPRQCEANDLKCLDVLITTPHRWWSAMCTSETCCPATGRELDPPHSEIEGHSPVALAWQELAEIVEQTRSSESLDHMEKFKELISRYASNITFRDCILAHCATKADNRDAWKHYFIELDRDSQTQTAMVSTVLASIDYLENNLSEAAEKLRVAFERDSTYSLAKLLRQGLLSEAPPSLLHSAFTVYSPEQLIAKMSR
ncbi:MAG: hypothetical protein RIS75_680 [Actinomycetota bacterium]